MDVRRLVVICILLALLVGCFAACSDESSTEYTPPEMLGFHWGKDFGDFGDSDAYVVVDPETGVEYILIRGYHAWAISPRYGSDGKVIVREVE